MIQHRSDIEETETPMHVSHVEGTVGWKAPREVPSGPGDGTFFLNFGAESRLWLKEPGQLDSEAVAGIHIEPIEFQLRATTFAQVLIKLRDEFKVEYNPETRVYTPVNHYVAIQSHDPKVASAVFELLDPFHNPRLQLVITRFTEDINLATRAAFTSKPFVYNPETQGTLVQFRVCIGDLVAYRAANPDFPGMTLSQLYSLATQVPREYATPHPLVDSALLALGMASHAVFAPGADVWANTIRERMRPVAIEFLNRGRKPYRGYPMVTDANLEGVIPLFPPGELPRDTLFEEVLLPDDPLPVDGNFDQHVALFPCAISWFTGEPNSNIYVGKEVFSTISRTFSFLESPIFIVDNVCNSVRPNTDNRFHERGMFTVFHQGGGPGNLLQAYLNGFRNFKFSNQRRCWEVEATVDKLVGVTRKQRVVNEEGEDVEEVVQVFSPEGRLQLQRRIDQILYLPNPIRRELVPTREGVIDTTQMLHAHILVALLGRYFVSEIGPAREAWMQAVVKAQMHAVGKAQMHKGLITLADSVKRHRNDEGGGGGGGGGSAGPAGGGSAGPAGGGSAGPRGWFSQFLWPS